MMVDQECFAGGCQCGAVRYELLGAPRDIYICHCTECRRQSSSAFGISVIAVSSSLRLIKGDPKCWSRKTTGGDRLDCHFCAECGTRLWHRGRVDADVVSIKGGSFDEPFDLCDTPHIWTRSRMKGVIIPDHVAQSAMEPERS